MMGAAGQGDTEMEHFVEKSLLRIWRLGQTSSKLTVPCCHFPAVELQHGSGLSPVRLPLYKIVGALG